MTGDQATRRLDVWDALSEGLSLATSRNGLLLMAAFYAVEVLTVLLIVAGGIMYLPLDQAASAVGEQSALPVGDELSLVASFGAILLASAFGVLVSTPVTVVTIRTFVVGATEHIPEDCLFYRLGRATLSAVGAMIVVSLVTFAIFLGGPIGLLLGVAWLLDGWVALVAIALGLLFLLGLYVIVWLHFLFVTHEVAVRDRRVLGALRGSVGAVRGNRIRLFVLGAIVTAVQGGLGWVSAPAFQGNLDPLTMGMLAVGLATSAVFGVAATAVLARAYRQVSPDDAVRADSLPGGPS